MQAADSVKQKKSLATIKPGCIVMTARRVTAITPATCGYTDHAPRRVPLAEDAQPSSQGQAGHRAPAVSVLARTGSRDAAQGPRARFPRSPGLTEAGSTS